MLDVSFRPISCFTMWETNGTQTEIILVAFRQQQPHASGYLWFGLKASVPENEWEWVPTFHCVQYNNFFVDQFREPHEKSNRQNKQKRGRERGKDRELQTNGSTKRIKMNQQTNGANSICSHFRVVCFPFSLSVLLALFFHAAYVIYVYIFFICLPKWECQWATVPLRMYFCIFRLH